MRNYAGHRLSPWLGHIMVSRQETPRPLLTPGEVMQLPRGDELVLMSGCPPLQAKKARYFEDRRFTERVLPPPQPGGTPAPVAADEWSALPLRWPLEAQAAQVHQEGEDTANSGLRREPDLPEHVAIANEATAPLLTREFDLLDDTDDSVALQACALSQQTRAVARQAALDPDDGLGM
jgi:type IV secretion system protein VirD4